MRLSVAVAASWLLALGACLSPLLAQNLPDAMATANQLYENGQFAESAGVYRQLIDRGHGNAHLYYNLGNAYFKQGDLGRAILNYRLAARLSPRDLDIRFNLILARTLTLDQIESEKMAEILRAVTMPQRWLTLNEVGIATLGVWFILATLGGSYILNTSERLKRGIGYAAATVSVLMIIGLLSLSWRLYVDARQDDAVVVADEVDVVSGPGFQYVNEFILHAGTEVRIVEHRATWIRLELPGGQLQGWVPGGALEKVVLPY